MTARRRSVLTGCAAGVAGLLVATLAATGPALASVDVPGGDRDVPLARFDDPHRGFAPASTRLRGSTPAAAGLDPAPIDAALAAVEGWTEPSDPPGRRARSPRAPSR